MRRRSRPPNTVNVNDSSPFARPILFGDVILTQSQKSQAKCPQLAVTAGHAWAMGNVPTKHTKHTKRIRANPRNELPQIHRSLHELRSPPRMKILSSWCSRVVFAFSRE